MGRPRNEDAYVNAKTLLLEVGTDLIRSGSYKGVGVNDVLREAGVPKGSFYHYFDSKKDFGLAIAEHYHADQLQTAKQLFGNDAIPALDQLKAFFQSAMTYFESRDYMQGCLMCNLSTEIADEDADFQALLNKHWESLSLEIAGCIAECDKSKIGLAHLSDNEAADWLLNSWSGALTRMKAVRTAAPLELFLKSTFNESK